MKRLAPDSKVTAEEVEALLPDVLKRDVLDGESASQAKKQVQRGMKRLSGRCERKITRRLQPRSQKTDSSGYGQSAIMAISLLVVALSDWSR